MSNIEVIPFVYDKDELDHKTHRVIHKKGDVVVSHGYDHEKLKAVCLPEDDYWIFVRAYCERRDGGYFIKE